MPGAIWGPICSHLFFGAFFHRSCPAPAWPHVGSATVSRCNWLSASDQSRLCWAHQGRNNDVAPQRRKAISKAHGWWTTLTVIIILITRPPQPYIQGADFKDHKVLCRLKKGPWNGLFQTRRNPLWCLSFLASTLTQTLPESKPLTLCFMSDSNPISPGPFPLIHTHSHSLKYSAPSHPSPRPETLLQNSLLLTLIWQKKKQKKQNSDIFSYGVLRC